MWRRFLGGSMKAAYLPLVLAFYVTSFLNLAFFRYLFRHIPMEGFADLAFLASAVLLIFSLSCFIFTLLTLPWIGRPILIVLFVTAGCVHYFMFELGVFVDSDMVRNVLQTSVREATDLLTPSFLRWSLLGLIPAFFLLRTRLIFDGFWHTLKIKGILILFSFLGLLLAVLPFYKDYVTFGRNHKNIVRLISPSNFVYAGARYLQKQRVRAPREIVRLDPEAKRIPDKSDKGRRRITLLLLGETARSMNFSLNGYARLTNPMLSKEKVISFQNVSSAGTSTAVSVPCMFSHLPKGDCKPDEAKYTENILELLQSVGYQIFWKDNDEGCKGVCDRLPTELVSVKAYPTFCKEDACFDEVLLENLEDSLRQSTKDIVLILHMMGSHGPSYYKRYPDAYRVFTPTCDTAEVRSCSQEAIINTYDNTILYSDAVIAKAIAVLKKFPEANTGLLYVSDHGESLGENGLYLHALPYAIAPKEQTQVPMILWLSENVKQNNAIDEACLKDLARHKAVSHDYLFHSLLGWMQTQSKLYQPALDFFALCRRT